MLTKKKICVVATVPVAIKVFMREHVLRLSEQYSISLVCTGAPQELESLFSGYDVRCIALDIERKISIWDDLKSLFKLRRLFVDEHFDAVHSLMPKAGLLAMLAARLAKVPVRVHIFTGQVWSTASGIKRIALKAMDRVLSACATHLLADSPSQRAFLVDEHVVAAEKISVLGLGSISGVDSARFRPDNSARAQIRAQFSIPDDALVFLFMARMTRAKGAVDMAQAFALFTKSAPSAHLLMVGPDEEGVEAELTELLADAGWRFHRLGFTDKPECYMAASDVFCLPSYREGFSLATIQAAGAGLPAVASRIYGLTDAVAEGVTGLMHEPGDIPAIVECMLRLHVDAPFREQLATAARIRAHEYFSQEYIVGEMTKFYDGVLA